MILNCQIEVIMILGNFHSLIELLIFGTLSILPVPEIDLSMTLKVIEKL